MSFLTEFVADFSSTRIDPKSDKYLSNTSDLSLSTWQAEIPGPEVKNQEKEDIENLFDLNLILVSCFPTFKKGLKHLLLIFNKYSSRL